MPLLFTPVDGKHAVIFDFGNELGIVGIHGIGALFVVLNHLDLNFAVIFKE